VKVLLDENLDHALRKLLGSHEVVTVTFMGWAGVQNGELLQAAEDNGIDVLLTGDQTLTFEQNLAGRRLAIVVLSAIQLPIIKNYLTEIVTAIDNAVPGSFQTVECGTFSRKNTPEE
jgi:predicted nuclease of predicted toxin-antitoxin system